LRGLHAIEFFSDLVSEVITIGQVKEITSHASPTPPTPRRVAPHDEPGLGHNAAGRRVVTNRPTHGHSSELQQWLDNFICPHVAAYPAGRVPSNQNRIFLADNQRWSYPRSEPRRSSLFRWHSLAFLACLGFHLPPFPPALFAVLSCTWQRNKESQFLRSSPSRCF
jgi:hypothetical protein